MAHVLIGFAEALPAPEVFFSLHDAGHQVSAFVRTGAKTPLITRFPFLSVHMIPAPETDAPAAIAALQAIMAAPEAPAFILPMDDGALWLANQALAGDGRIAGAQGAAAAVALNKIEQVAAAQKAGLAVPPTVVVRSPQDLTPGLPFPAIAKPAMAVQLEAGRLGKDGVHYLSEAKDVAQLKTELPQEMAPLLVQPLVAGTGEGVFGFVTTAGVVNWSGHRRLRMMNPHGSGSSACLSVQPEPALKEACAAFLADIQWRGPFMIELLRDAQGTPWFMELNGRMWGSMALARAQGLEYPAWAVAQAQDPAFSPPQIALPDQVIEAQHLGRDLLHLLFVLRGPKADFYKEGWPRFLDSLRAVIWGRPGRRRYNTHPDFRFYAWKEAWHLLRQTLRKAAG